MTLPAFAAERRRPQLSTNICCRRRRRRCCRRSTGQQSKQWVDWSWVIWVMGRIDTLSPMTHQRHTATDVFDPLYWWEQHEQSYPILSDCTRRLLVIPASSAACERHFSAFNARHIINSQRNLLFPETVEAVSIVLERHKNELLQ